LAKFLLFRLLTFSRREKSRDTLGQQQQKKFEMINKQKTKNSPDKRPWPHPSHAVGSTFFCAVLHNIYNMESKKRPEFLHRVFLLCSFFEFCYFLFEREPWTGNDMATFLDIYFSLYELYIVWWWELIEIKKNDSIRIILCG
jgi:hypothetical protein